MITDNYTSTLVQAVESCWSAIRQQHTQVRPAIFTLGEGSRRNAYGWYRPCAWSVIKDKSTIDVMHLEGSTLSAGGAGAFKTILHEAMHSLAFARNEKDTSRAGRYHNGIFKALAIDAGLTVEKDKRIGWTTPGLTEQALIRYATPIAQLDGAIAAYMLTNNPLAGKPKQSMLKMTCGCDRIIRVTRKVLRVGPISCGVCGRDFLTSDE